MNTDPSNMPGTHWISIWIDLSMTQRGGGGQFFDSYGTDVPVVFRNYLQKHTDQWDFNRRTLQSIWSDVCGHYCLFYLTHKARGYSMNRIVNMFGNNTMDNDNKVFNFVNQHFKILPKSLGNQHIQLSKKFVKT